MRILLIHRYFWPDAPPYASMLRTIGARLVDNGHDVSVLSAQPSYNTVTATGRRPAIETVDGVRIQRMRLPSKCRGAVTRVVNSAFFLIQAFCHVLRRRDELVMFSTMPPVALGVVVRAALAWSGRAGRYVYHCQDIHPEAAHIAGLMRYGPWYRWLRAVDTATCRRAAAVVVLSGDMCETMIRRGVEADRVHVLNNFALVDPGPATAPPAQLVPSRDAADFVVVFAGNLGRFQQLDTLIDAVHELRDDPTTHLWIVGDGVMRDQLRNRAGDLVGHTVHFVDYQSPETAFGILEQADLSVVSLRAGMYRVAYPSKTMTSLMAGCRLLVVAEQHSELARSIREARLGTGAPPGDPRAIAQAIRWERRSRHAVDRRHVRSHALQHHAADGVADRWIRLLTHVGDEVAA